MARKLLFIPLLFLSTTVYAGQTFNAFTGKPDKCMSAKTEDGTVAANGCNVLKVTDGTLVDNGDGTFSLTTGAGVGAGGWVDDGTEVRLDSSTDEVEIGSAGTLSSKLGVNGDADEIQLLIQGNATQTNNNFVVEKSDGTDLFSIGAGGDVITSGTVTLQGVAYTFPASDGTADTTLTTDGSGSLSWQTSVGSGDVSGPGSSTDNEIVRFDGATGKIIQSYTSGGPTISDTGTHTATQPLILDDTSLQIQEGADTLTITAPALTAARAVTFPDAAGEVSLLGQSIADAEVDDDITLTNLSQVSDAQEAVEDYAGALVTDGTGTHTGIDITYQDASGDVDFVVDMTEFNTLTLGSGTYTTLTFDAGVSDPVITASSGALNVSTGTLSVGGNAVYDTGDATGADATVVTGTAGGAGLCAEWNADGDLVEAASAAACGSGDAVTVNGTGADTTANFLDGDIDWTLADGGAGGPDNITATVGCTGCVDVTDMGADSVGESELIEAMNFTTTGSWIFSPTATGAFDAYDAQFGDVTTPDYGGIRIGASGLYRTSAAPGTMDFGGAMILRNEANLDVGNDPGIEFAIMEQGNSVRFMIPESGAGNASNFIRSAMLGVAYSQTSGNAQVTCDQLTSYDSNIDCDTSQRTNRGGDFFVADDIELEGEIYLSNPDAVGVIHFDSDDASSIQLTSANATGDRTITLPDTDLDFQNGFDPGGAIDIDYGSADITDHTFIADGGTVIIDGSVTADSGMDLGTSQALVGTTAMTIGDGSQTVAVNSSDWDIDATGIATGMGNITSDGLITVVSVDASQTVSGTVIVSTSGQTELNNVVYHWPVADGTANYVLSTDSTGNLSWKADADSGGATAYDNITDPTGVGLITFNDGETATYDSASDDESFFTISLNAADLTGDTEALLITAVDNDDANYIPILIQDDQDGTPDNLFKVDYQGTVTTVSVDASQTVSGTVVVSTSGDMSMADVYYQWPGSDGSSGQYLSTDGSGALSWATASGSGLWTDLAGTIEPNDAGDAVRVKDATDTDYCDQSHDGTDYNFACTTTTQITMDVPLEIGGTAQSTITEGLVVNDGAGGDADDDFRVESTGEPNLFVVDASTDEVFIGDYDTNYIKITKGGVMTLAGTASIPETNAPKIYFWDAAALLPLEGVAAEFDGIAPLSKDTDTNEEIYTRLYDATGDECTQAQFIVPYDAVTSGTVVLYNTWYATTASGGDTVRWDYRWHEVGDGEDWDGSLTNTNANASTSASTQDVVTKTTWSREISDLGWVAGDTVKGYVCRDGDHTTDDTLSSDAELIDFSIRIPRE